MAQYFMPIARILTVITSSLRRIYLLVCAFGGARRRVPWQARAPAYMEGPQFLLTDQQLGVALDEIEEAFKAGTHPRRWSGSQRSLREKAELCLDI